MAEAMKLTVNAVDEPDRTPPAATAPRVQVRKRKPVRDAVLQVRVTSAELRAIKMEALKADQSLSEFISACFKAFLTQKKG